MTDLLRRLEHGIQSRGLFKRGSRILVAVSGGVDSMTLLHALKELSSEHRWQLVIAHFNHRLRGRASDADERLVRKTAVTMRLPLVSGGANVKVFAVKSKLSLEMAARKLRHEFLADTARKQKIKTIALAHHADDQVELFFLRLLRGTGGEGLAGMKWRSPSPADPKITLVRPMLGLSKTQLLAFAREYKIHFREDATNASADFLRNRIRHKLLPLLRKHYQPALDRAVLRLMEIIGAEAQFVGEAAKAAVSRRLGKLRPKTRHDIFRDLPVAVQRRVLQAHLMELGVPADFELIESLRCAPDIFVSAGPKIFLARQQTGEIILRTEAEPVFDLNELAVTLWGGQRETFFSGMKYCWQTIERKNRQGRLNPAIAKRNRECFDADKVGGEIVLRHWRAGDRFQPIGLKSPVKLQDLFVNAKIPRERRRALALATTARGEIFWVQGLRIGERFKLTPQTARKLVWQWSNLAV